MTSKLSPPFLLPMDHMFRTKYTTTELEMHDKKEKDRLYISALDNAKTIML